MSDKPLVSVIVPCFNQGKYLNDTLQCIYNQTYSNWEALLINDGSTDNTEEIASRWVRKDGRFRYFYKPNGGLSSARNKGLDESKGFYIQFLDADDLIEEDKLLDSLQQAGNADVVISDFLLFSKKNRLQKPAFKLNIEMFNLESIAIGWDDQFVIPIHCGIFKSTIFENLRFNESLRAREDWLMWVQVYLQRGETRFIDKPYALYRKVPGSMSQGSAIMNANLILSYQLINQILPLDSRELFFKKVTDTLGTLLKESEALLEKTRKSSSYRLGNFMVRNFAGLNKKNRMSSIHENK